MHSKFVTRWMVAAVVVLAAAGSARGQDAKPLEAPALESLDALLEPIRAQFELPALGGAVVTGKGLIAVGACGVRARGKDVKVTVDDKWHLGSCTKAMTATLVAKLVERGDLKWSTTIGEVLTPWSQKRKDAWRDVPIEWLLQNRSGMCGNPPGALWSKLWKTEDSPSTARAWFAGQLLEVEPEAEPGTKFIYSNQGFMVAGALVQKLKKTSWEELMVDELFTPLGMHSAGFGPPGTAGKLDQPLGHASEPIDVGPRADNPPALGPAGTVHCSLGDWAKFVAAHLNGANGVDGALKAGTFQKLHTSAPGQEYAMGWGRSAREWAGGDVLTHSGSNTMWFCVVWIAPKKDVAFLATTNIAGEAAQKGCDAAIGAMLRSRQL
jgi:CubicO group peptidase (beta-lactamase class C family)